ncbi:MAG: protein kinase [Bryobacteraceae bacterium]
MTELIWEQIEGDYAERNLRLRKLLSSDRGHAIFLGDYLRSREDEREVLIRLFLEDGDNPEQRLNRLLEATFFEHPHIVRSFEAGLLSRGEFTFSYAVTEQGEAPAVQSLSEEEALAFTSQIISSLRYLHSKNLVYCMLSPQTVVKVGTDWKLGDFSELRVRGNDEGYGTLSLAARVDTTPPEAVEGIISSAWDIWSLGKTLRSLVKEGSKHTGELQANRRDADTNGGHPSPDPFRSVILACLNVNPSSRPSLDQLSALLHSAETGTPRDERLSLWKARGSGL